MAIKTTMSEVNQIIKEEFQRLMEKRKIKSRIQQINEELAMMEEEDQALEEVEASGTEKVRSHAWTGKEDGDEKFAPKFEKKGSHLLEDEDEEEVLDVEDAGEESEDEGMDLADEFAELGAAIEAKIKAAIEGEAEVEESEDSEGAEENGEEEEFEEVEVEEPMKESHKEEKEDHYKDAAEDDYAHIAKLKKDAAEDKEKEEMINESKSAKKSPYLNVLSEGLDNSKKSALQSEIERMRKLAKLDNNE